MDGVLVVDKPRGLTSHDVVATARRGLGERRVGHTGTLDPIATGVLPLVCGRATRLARFLTASDKDYDAWIRFGLSTDTYDATGVEVRRSGLVPTRDAIEHAVGRLRGEYDQLPPPFSAKQVDGERAYARARREEPVHLRPVRVRVTRADVLDLTDGLARIAITCSAGFYVRSFAHELGNAVETGACLEGLRRTRSGDFTLDQAVELDRVLAGESAVRSRWIALDGLLTSWPAVRLTEEGCRRASRGQDVSRLHAASHDRVPMPDPWPRESEWIRLLDGDGRLLALAQPGRISEFLHPTVVLT